MLPINALVIVLLLFQLEYMLNEELLEIFVGIIDAKLLEAVVVEVLETEDVQHAYSTAGIVLRPVYGLVNFLYNMYEQSTIYALHKRISNIDRLLSRQRGNLLKDERFTFNTIVFLI